MLFFPYTYCYFDPRPTLREVRRTFWNHIARIRIWLPPWKQQLLPPLHPRAARLPNLQRRTGPAALTIRRERFQWKRKMTRLAALVS